MAYKPVIEISMDWVTRGAIGLLLYLGNEMRNDINEIRNNHVITAQEVRSIQTEVRMSADATRLEFNRLERDIDKLEQRGQ